MIARIRSTPSISREARASSEGSLQLTSMRRSSEPMASVSSLGLLGALLGAAPEHERERDQQAADRDAADRQSQRAAGYAGAPEGERRVWAARSHVADHHLVRAGLGNVERLDVGPRALLAHVRLPPAVAVERQRLAAILGRDLPVDLGLGHGLVRRDGPRLLVED